MTPFFSDYSIDESLFNSFGRELLDRGCEGLLLFGTTGEALSVGSVAKISALRSMVSSGISGDRLLFGAGLCDLLGSVELCRAACDEGCLGVMLLPPFYYGGVSDDGLFAYFSRLIELVDRDNLRIYLYHIPQVCGVGFSIDLVRRLFSAFPSRIVGIKDSSGDRDNLLCLLSIEGLVVYPGSELFLLDALSGGGSGCITASANLNSFRISEIVRLYDSGGDYQSLFDSVCGYREVLQRHALVPALKGLLGLSDKRWRPLCLPLEVLGQDESLRLRDDLAQFS